MSEMKHTPGPWRVDDGRILGNEPSVENDDVLICDVASNNEALTDFDEANARLIAAAPDLLLACQAALALLEDNGQQGGPKWTKDTLRKAISKATDTTITPSCS